MDLQQLREGQNVRVIQKVTEGKRGRNVPFVGKLLKVRGSGVNKTITVKQTLEGVDVEKIFPVMSPILVSIEIIVEKTRHTQAPKRARKSPKKTGKK
jgi:large subunit ribosomal protein L19